MTTTLAQLATPLRGRRLEMTVITTTPICRILFRVYQALMCRHHGYKRHHPPTLQLVWSAVTRPQPPAIRLRRRGGHVSMRVTGATRALTGSRCRIRHLRNEPEVTLIPAATSSRCLSHRRDTSPEVLPGMCFAVPDMLSEVLPGMRFAVPEMLSEVPPGMRASTNSHHLLRRRREPKLVLFQCGRRCMHAGSCRRTGAHHMMHV